MRKIIDSEFIADWLDETDPTRIEDLLQQANTMRQISVGDKIHLRGLVEFSNICVCSCTYCGLRVQNDKLPRYRMSWHDILECAGVADHLEYGTVVLQSGDDPTLNPRWLGSLISEIKDNYDLTVTLSLGEQTEEVYRYWHECGAERYLLKFETSDDKLFALLHPGKKKRLASRIEQLYSLKKLGYETGAGIMVGLPGQTRRSVRKDIELFAELELDMIGIGPYIPHPDTPLSKFDMKKNADGPYMINDALTTCKTIALARLACPQANIPATTALASIDPDGLEKGLHAGANVIMPNITPRKYRSLYRIYPRDIKRLSASFSKTFTHPK